MKHLGTIFGTAIAGMFGMSVWGEFAGSYGIAGGWFAGFAIIGTMWFLNHFVGIHNNDGAWVDMALGIGVAGTTKDLFLGNATMAATFPTWIVVIIGGVVGGFTAYMLESKVLNKQ
jgi:hypothetical protein